MNLAWSWALVSLALVLRVDSFSIVKGPPRALCSERTRNVSHQNEEKHRHLRNLGHGLGAGDMSAGAGIISIPGEYKEKKRQKQRQRNEDVQRRGGPFSAGISVEGREVDHRPNIVKWLPRPVRRIVVRGNERIMTFWAKQMDREALQSMMSILSRELTVRIASDGIGFLPAPIRAPATDLVDATIDALEDATHNFFEWKDDRDEEQKRV